MPQTGFVVRYNDVKCYGFIRPDAPLIPRRDVFVHRSAIVGARALVEGQRVTFDVDMGDDRGPTAIDVRPFGDDAC